MRVNSETLRMSAELEMRESRIAFFTMPEKKFSARAWRVIVLMEG